MENIIAAVKRNSLIEELNSSILLGKTTDNKTIYLVSMPNCENVLLEIGRLREITFRAVGEGTGKKYDLDNYDSYYKHIVVWDAANSEIVGAYRLGVCVELINNYGVGAIYNNELFHFNNNFVEVIQDSIEVGRSFVQQKYWNSNALDYLWQGIGAFLNMFPKRYLFGAVSISDSYPEHLRNLIVLYYSKWFGSTNDFAVAKNPLTISMKKYKELTMILNGENYSQDFRILKKILLDEGYNVPVLLRKYTDICHFGGVEFADFGIDPSFANSTDCFICVDLEYLKEEFKLRYMGTKSFVKEKVAI